MKASRLSIVLCGAALLCSVPAFAGNEMKRSLQINENVTVQGVQLPPGNYKVEWNGPGPEVQVKILKGHDTMATVPAHVVQEASSNHQDGYALKPGSNGQQNLSEIFFTGEKYDLQLDQNANRPANSPSSSR